MYGRYTTRTVITKCSEVCTGRDALCLSCPCPLSHAECSPPAVVGNGGSLACGSLQVRVEPFQQMYHPRKPRSPLLCNFGVTQCSYLCCDGDDVHVTSLPSLCLTCSSGDFPSSVTPILEMLPVVPLLLEQHHNAIMCLDIHQNMPTPYSVTPLRHMHPRSHRQRKACWVSAVPSEMRDCRQRSC